MIGLATWNGDDEVLPVGAEVTVLATDPEDPAVPARRACWVRYWPDTREAPMYRSCDLNELIVAE